MTAKVYKTCRDCFSMKSFVWKHLTLIPPYILLSLKHFFEYKFNVITNTLSYVFFVTMWIVFWNVLLSNIKQLGEWTLPMAIMLTGFIMISETIWQIMWASIRLYYDIPSGVLDLYLVRPVQPIFAMIVKEIQVFSLIPCAVGLALVTGTFVTSFTPSILKLFFALIITLCGALVITLGYVVIGCCAFWIGRSDSLRSFYRSFLFIKSYPTTIFPYPVTMFLTFIVPITLFATLPVLVMTKYSVAIGFEAMLIALATVVAWFLFAMFMWRQGLRSYESQGG